MEEGLMQNRIKQIVDASVGNIRMAADTESIVGKPFVTATGSTVFPISQLSFAFVAGGGEYGNHKTKDNANQFAGGSGGGATLTPVGFLVVNADGISLTKFDDESALHKFADVADALMGMFKN